MIHRTIAIFAVAVAFCGCGPSTRSTPSLTAPPVAAGPVGPSKPGLLEEVGDTTWRVVTAPARLVSPKKPAPRQQPETYDPPSVTIVRRGATEEAAEEVAPTPPTPPAGQ